MSFWQNKSVLITGGTGSLGSALVEKLLSYPVRKIIVLSRDEAKHFALRQRFSSNKLRYFVGDVRDKTRLQMAFGDVDIVIHTAALKRIEVGEYDPIEFVKTNILGTQNVVESAIEKNVQKVMLISTDKVCAAENLYGMTKGVAEKLIVLGNSYSGDHKTRFACVRYGNVVGSRGSIVPIFKEQIRKGKATITDPRATRFWITMPQAVDFVLSSIEMMKGEEVFVPKLTAASVETILAAVGGMNCDIEIVGLKNGEKKHEVLLSPTELNRTVDIGDRYVVTKNVSFDPHLSSYASNLVEQMSVEEVRQIIDSL